MGDADHMAGDMQSEQRHSENGQLREALEASHRALERVNAKLVEAESIKSHFLSNIRNEINNPLTAVLGIAENMKDERYHPDEMKAMAQMMYQEAFKLDFQLRTIFSAAEIEAGEAYPHAAWINIHLLMRRLIDSFAELVHEKAISLTVQGLATLKGAAARFWSDPEKLHLILAHLLSNAIEFSARRGCVHVDVNRAERLRVRITDRGCGIAPEDQVRIFDRFVQLDAGMTKAHHGHGLGLAVARSAAELLGGVISVESAEGEGAIFTLDIPELEADSSAHIFAIDGNEELF